MQLVDELSMIYTTCLMMHASFSYSRSQIFSVALGVGLLSLAGSITVSTSMAIFTYTRTYTLYEAMRISLSTYDSHAERRLALLLHYPRSHLPSGSIRCFDRYRRFSEYLGDGVAGTASFTRPRPRTGFKAAEYDVGHDSYWCVTL